MAQVQRGVPMGPLITMSVMMVPPTLWIVGRFCIPQLHAFLLFRFHCFAFQLWFCQWKDELVDATQTGLSSRFVCHRFWLFATSLCTRSFLAVHFCTARNVAICYAKRLRNRMVDSHEVPPTEWGKSFQRMTLCNPGAGMAGRFGLENIPTKLD